jgi:hypothetical protein
MLYMTPDEKNIVEVGIKGGKYYTKGVWNINNDANQMHRFDDNDWKSTGRD